MKSSKLDPRLSRIIQSSTDTMKNWRPQDRCGILNFDPKKPLDDFILRVIIVLEREIKELPDYVHDGRIIDFRGKYIVGEFQLRHLKKLQAYDEVKHISLPGPLSPDLQQAVPSSGWRVELTEDIRTRFGIEDIWDGSGVLLGFIDTGIDFDHPDFIDANGNTIIEWIYEDEQRQWDFNTINQAVRNNNPGAIDHRDLRAHGTAVAACAASTGMGTGCRGIAPGARLLMMAVNNGDLTSDDPDNNYLEAIVLLKDYMLADIQNRPLVINLSKGENEGPRDGSLAFEGWLDQLLTDFPQILLCKSSGNDGAKNHHAGGNVRDDIANSQDPVFRVTENLQDGNSINSLWMDIWYSSSSVLEFSLIGPDGTESRLFDENILDLTHGILSDAALQINAYVSFNRNDEGKNYYILINTTDTTQALPPDDYRIRLRGPGNSSTDTEYDIWLDYSGFHSANLNLPAEFLLPHLSDAGTLNTGATGIKPIIVGAYDNFSGEISPFSSRGPTRDGRQGLDIVSPGSNLLAAKPLLPGSGQSLLSLWSGSSFSCPLVAGTAALILQKELAENGVSLVNDELKQCLKSTCVRDFFSGSGPNSVYGDGKLHIMSALYELPGLPPHTVYFETRPHTVLVGRPVDCYIQILDELKRPLINDEGLSFSISAGQGSPDDFSEIAGGILESGGQLLSLPAFPETGSWNIVVSIPDLSIEIPHSIQVYNSIPNISAGTAEETGLFESKVQLQYYWNGNNDLGAIVEAIGFPAPSEEVVHAAYFWNMRLTYGYIDEADFSLSDVSATNLQSVTDPVTVEYRDLEPNLYAGELFRIDFPEPLLFEGHRKFLLHIEADEIHSRFAIQQIATADADVQLKKWVGGSLRQLDTTTNIPAPILLSGAQNNAIDIWLKTTEADDGEDPVTGDPFFYSSPDIELPFGIRVFQDNQISVRLRNRGILEARRSRVEILWANSFDDSDSIRPVPPWNTSFFSFVDENNNRLEGNVQLADIPPDSDFDSEYRTVEFFWHPPADVLDGSPRVDKHFIVRLSHPSDPLPSTDENINAVLAWNNIAITKFRVSLNTGLDLWFRAHPADDGSREEPVSDNRNSPDIVVRNFPDTIDGDTLSQDLLLGVENQVFLKLRHLSFVEQRSVQVKLFWTTELGELDDGELRADHIFFKTGNGLMEGNLQRIDLLPNPFNDPDRELFTPVNFVVNIPDEEIPTANNGKIYLVATAHHSNDRLLGNPREAWFAGDNSVARKLISSHILQDIRIRDNEKDTGQIPSPGEFDRSPDILLSSESLQNPFNHNSSPLVAGSLNHVYVRVHNQGIKPVENVVVELLWLAVRSQERSEDHWKEQWIAVDGRRGNRQIAEIPAKGEAIVHFTFSPSFPRSIAMLRPPQNGIYLIARAMKQGEAIPGLSDIRLVNFHKNMACKRILFRQTTLRNYIYHIMARLWRSIRELLGGG